MLSEVSNAQTKCQHNRFFQKLVEIFKGTLLFGGSWWQNKLYYGIQKVLSIEIVSVCFVQRHIHSVLYWTCCFYHVLYCIWVYKKIERLTKLNQMKIWIVLKCICSTVFILMFQSVLVCKRPCSLGYRQEISNGNGSPNFIKKETTPMLFSKKEF